MMQKDIKIKVPLKAKTELLECLVINKPSFPFNIDSFLYIFNKFVELPEINRKFKHLNKIPISSKILRYEIGKHYRKYLDYLLDHKFIMTDNHYIVSNPERDGKCKCYNLTLKYRKDSLCDHSITKKHLLAKILGWKEKNFGKNISDPMLNNLYTMMKEFKIDIQGATKYLQTLYRDKKITKRKMDMEIQKCMKINSGDNEQFALFISKDKYDRVHTNFTNLSRHIRENFLHLNGEKVIGIDVVSCQPALLHTLFADYIKHVKDELGDYIDDCLYIPTHINRTDIREKYTNSFNSYYGKPVYEDAVNFTVDMFGCDTYKQVVDKATIELQRYERILKIGIYEYFVDQWNLMFDESITRDQIKKQWVSYVFSRTQKKYHGKMHIIWSNQFPMLSKILNHFKRDDYRSLAHSLQKKEAKMIYSDLCHRINGLGMKYFTVHDSIVVKESDVDDVVSVFENVLSDNNIVTGVSYDY